MAQGQLVQLDTDSGETSCTPTLATGATAGNLLVICVRTAASGGVGANTPTDFTAGPTESATRGGIAMFAKIAVGGETAISVSAASTASVGAIIAEYEGPFNGTTPWDQSQTGTSGNSAVTSLSSGTTGTLSQADELVVACFGQIQGLNNTSSYTNSLVEETGGDFTADLTVDLHLSVASKIVAATTAVESTATFSSNGRAKAAIWTFELGAAGTPGTATPSAISRSFGLAAVSPVNSDGGSAAVAATARSFVLPAPSESGGAVVSPPLTALSVVIPVVAANDVNPGNLPDAAIIALYDARNIAGSPTDPVSAWSDEGPVGQDDLVQASGTLQPLISDSGFGGVRALEFDGADDYMTVTLDQSYSGDFALIVAVEWLTDPDTSSYVVYSTGAGTNKNILGSDTEDDGKWVVMSGDGTQPAHHQATNDATYLGNVPSRFVMTQLVRNAGEHRLWENGVLIVDVDPSNPSGDNNDMGALYLGCREDISRHANIRVGYVLLVDMAETDQTTLLAADAELRTAFGISGSSGSVSPTQIARSFALNAVTVDGPAVSSPTQVSGAFGINPVSVSGSAAPAPTHIARSFSVNAATPSGGGVVNPAQVARVFVLPAASPEAAGTTAAPDEIGMSVVLPAPSVSGVGSVAPAEIGLAFTLPSVTVVGGGTVTPAQVALSFTLPAVSISAGGSATAAPNAIAAAFGVNGVTPVSPTSVAVAASDAVITIPQVSPAGTATTTPDQIAAVVGLDPATPISAGTVTPDGIGRAFTIPGVTVTGTAGTTPGSIDLLVVIPSVTAANSDAASTYIYQEGGVSVSIQFGGGMADSSGGASSSSQSSGSLTAGSQG